MTELTPREPHPFRSRPPLISGDTVEAAIRDLLEHFPETGWLRFSANTWLIVDPLRRRPGEWAGHARASLPIATPILVMKVGRPGTKWAGFFPDKAAEWLTRSWPG